MKKKDVEMVLCRVTVEDEDAILIKMGKDGTLYRQGAGGLPQVEIAGLSRFDKPDHFSRFMALCPQEIIEHPMEYVEMESPQGLVEFTVTFLGESKNGEHGNEAEWAQSNVLRVKVAPNSMADTPLKPLVEELVIKASQITNRWYFDVIMEAAFKAISNELPEDTRVEHPENEQDIQEEYSNYILQMLQSPYNGNIRDLAKDKSYQIESYTAKPIIDLSDTSFNLQFKAEVGPEGETPEAPEKKKPWWKLF